MPEGWKPAPFGLDTQCHKIESGWSTDDLLRHLEAFKAHHRREGSKFVDWQAAWSAWVLNSERFGKQRTNGQHRPAEPDSYVDVLEREERNRAILAARNANPEAAAGRG